MVRSRTGLLLLVVAITGIVIAWRVATVSDSEDGETQRPQVSSEPLQEVAAESSGALPEQAITDGAQAPPPIIGGGALSDASVEQESAVSRARRDVEVYGLCARLAGTTDEHRSKRDSLYSHPILRRITRECRDRGLQREVLDAEAVSAALAVLKASPDHNELEAILERGADSGDIQSLERELLDLIGRTSDPDVLIDAMVQLLLPERARALIEGSLGPGLVDISRLSELVRYAGLLEACSQRMLDCGPGSPVALSLCLSTPLCLSPMDVESLLRLRNSPSEMHALQSLRSYISRRGGG
jgi:hypothetical protein